jgi:hypothetical protein
MKRYSALAMLCVCQVFSSGCGGPSIIPSPGPKTYPATWITASWSGGRTTTPSDERTMQVPQYPLSPICPPNALTLENYNYPELLSLRMLGDCPLGTTTCSNLVLVNNCNASINVGVCLASGSGGSIPPGANLRTECAQDPMQTPQQNLFMTTLAANFARNEISQVSPNLAISVFFCGGNDVVDGTPLKCQTF